MSSEHMDSYDFSVTITNPHSFKDLVRGFSSLLVNAPFQFIHGQEHDSFSGIKVCCIDKTNTVFVDAQYKAHVKGISLSGCPETLILNVKTLLSIMKKVSNNCVCYLKKKHDQDKIHIVYEDNTGYHHFFIKTETSMSHTLEFTKPSIDFSMDFKVNLLKSFIRTSKTLGSDHVSIEILQSKHNDSRMYIKFSFNTPNLESGGIRIFKTSTNFKSITMTKDVSYSEVNTLYKSQFRNSYLDMILKTLDKDSTISIGLRDKSPLLIRYDQGLDDTFTQFIVASYETSSSS